MKISREERANKIKRILKASGLKKYSAASERLNKYLRKEITWEQATSLAKKRIVYDRCMVNCIIEKTGLRVEAARRRFMRFMDGELTADEMFSKKLPSGPIDTRVFFTYLGVKYYVKDVAEISGCAKSQARFKIHKVNAGTMTGKKALAKYEGKVGYLGKMQPRRRIEDIKIGSWEQAQVDGNK